MKIIGALFGSLSTFVLIAAINGCGSHVETSVVSAPIPSVETVKLITGNLDNSISVSGTLSPLPNEEATIVPQVAGTLTQLNIIPGQRVEKGQIIAQIAAQLSQTAIMQSQSVLEQDEVGEQQAEANAIQQKVETQSTILQARATIESARAGLAADIATLTGIEATLANASKNLSREQTLFAEGLVAQKDVDQSELDTETAKSQLSSQQQVVAAQQQSIRAQQSALSAALSGKLEDVVKEKDVTVAKQQVENAKAAVAASEIQASLYTIRSPLDGIVTAVGANVGETADTTTKIATISNLSRLQLSLNVPGNVVSQVARGQKIHFGSNARFVATVQSIAPSYDVNSGTVQVLSTVDNSSLDLKDDMTVSANIEVAEHNKVLIAPLSAITTDPTTGEKLIGVVGTDNVLHFRPVQIGLETSSDVEIDGGAKTGERIVVDGAYGLSDGTVVAPIDKSNYQTASNGS